MILLALAMASTLTLLTSSSFAGTIAILVSFVLSLPLLGLIMAYYLLQPEAAGAQLEDLNRWTPGHSTQIAGTMSRAMGALIFFSSLSLLR